MTTAASIVIENLVVMRGGKSVLHGIDMTIGRGEIVALVGANGAGKSTTVMAIAGMLPVRSGRIAVNGRSLIDKPPETVRHAGVAVVPEGHRVLGDLTVLDNLKVAGTQHSRRELATEIERALDLFPELKERLSVQARALSGGQKQMVAMVQAFIAKPDFLLVDELSLGLAPFVVKRLAATLVDVVAGGIGVLLIEQFTTLALGISSRAYVLERGNIVFAGTSAELKSRPDILHSAYLAADKARAAER